MRFRTGYICYRHIVKPGITRNAWTFQTLREVTNSLSRFMKWLKSLGISRNEWNFDVQITLSAWTGLDNKRNITRDALKLFKSYCSVCQEKTKRPVATGVVVRPILSHDFNSKGQVDLVDMQSKACGSYIWIMVYQCHMTKFVIIRPITTKRASEVAF